MQRSRVRQDFAIDTDFANATCNKLSCLGTEVENNDAFDETLPELLAAIRALYSKRFERPRFQVSDKVMVRHIQTNGCYRHKSIR